jgi:hypothetical protein
MSEANRGPSFEISRGEAKDIQGPRIYARPVQKCPSPHTHENQIIINIGGPNHVFSNHYFHSTCSRSIKIPNRRQKQGFLGIRGTRTLPTYSFKQTLNQYEYAKRRRIRSRDFIISESIV